MIAMKKPEDVTSLDLNVTKLRVSADPDCWIGSTSLLCGLGSRAFRFAAGESVIVEYQHRGDVSTHCPF